MGGREVSRPYQVGFCFCAPRIYPLNLCMGELVGKKKTHIDSLGFSSD